MLNALRTKAPLFPIQLEREIDIHLAVEQVAKIQTGPLEVHSVDLKITPIEGTVRIVVIDLAIAVRVFGALHGKGNAAGRTEFVAGILLIGRETVAELVGASLGRNSF